MKIDITSLAFNSKLLMESARQVGEQPWVKKWPDYPITVEGANEILNSMNQDSIKIHFIPSNPLHNSNITNLKKKIIIAAGKYDKVYVNDNRINAPFILLVVE